MHVAGARSQAESYRPSLLDRGLRRSERRRRELAEEIDAAKRRDGADFDTRQKTYDDERRKWEASRRLAEDVLAGDFDAYANVFRDAMAAQDLTGMMQLP